jgi:hypothetical protein
LNLKNKYLSSTFTIALIISLLFAVTNFQDVLTTYKNQVSFSRTELASVAHWVAKNVSKKSIVLVHDAGYISLFGSQPLLDIVGLKNQSSELVHEKFSLAHCIGPDSHAIDDIARKNHANYFVVLDEWDRLFKLTQSLKYYGWKVTRVDSDRGKTHYKVYEIIPPNTLR